MPLVLPTTFVLGGTYRLLIQQDWDFQSVLPEGLDDDLTGVILFYSLAETLSQCYL